MGKNWLDAHSDGVIAIFITIMVLKLKVPHRVDLAALLQLMAALRGYVLGFIYLGIYWNKHNKRNTHNQLITLPSIRRPSMAFSDSALTHSHPQHSWLPIRHFH